MTRCSSAPRNVRRALPANTQRRVLRARASPDPGGGEPERPVRHRRKESPVRAARRAMTNDLADGARALFERDAEISRYYNTQLAGGKWDHMMDQTHIGYTYWQEPPRNTMPRVDVIQLPIAADMGVAIVEENRAPTSSRGAAGPFLRRRRMMSRDHAARVRPISTADLPSRHLQSRPDAIRLHRAKRRSLARRLSGARHESTKRQRVCGVDRLGARADGTTPSPITVSASNGGKFVVQAVDRAIQRRPSPTKSSASSKVTDTSRWRRSTIRARVNAGAIKWLRNSGSRTHDVRHD